MLGSAKYGLMIVTVSVAALAISHSNVSAATPEHRAVGSSHVAARSLMTRVERPVHHRAHHHRSVASYTAARGPRAYTAATPASRAPLPAPAPRQHSPRATVPALRAGFRHSRTFRGSGFAVPGPGRHADAYRASRRLALGNVAEPGMWFDPIRSGRGPPRAGPLDSSPDAIPPASSGLTLGADLSAPGSRFDSLDIARFIHPPAFARSDLPLRFTQMSETAPRRLIACRVEGAAGRSLMPS
jgi:hypothetical protein